MAITLAPEKPRQKEMEKPTPPQPIENRQSRISWLNWVKNSLSRRVQQKDPETPASEPEVADQKRELEPIQLADSAEMIQRPPTIKLPRVRGPSSANTGPKIHKTSRGEDPAPSAAIQKKKIQAVPRPITDMPEVDQDVKEEQDFLQSATSDEIRNIALIRLQTLVRSENPPVQIAESDQQAYSALIGSITNGDVPLDNAVISQIEAKLKSAQVTDPVWKSLLQMELTKLRQTGETKQVPEDVPKTFGFINNKLVPLTSAATIEAEARPLGFLEPNGADLPESVKSWKRTRTNVVVTSDQLHWLKENHDYPVALDRVKFTPPNAATDQEILLGSLIQGSEMTAELKNLKDSPSGFKEAEKIFFRDLGLQITGKANRRLHNTRSSKDIFIASGGAKNERVYYIQPGSIDGTRVIVIVGAYKKRSETTIATDVIAAGK